LSDESGNVKQLSSNPHTSILNRTTDPSTSTYQRPFGCAVVPFSSLGLLSRARGLEIDPGTTVKIYRPLRDIERQFQNVHEAIVNGVESELEEVPQSKGIKLTYALVQGDLHSLRDKGFAEGVESVPLRSKLVDASVTGGVVMNELADPRDQREEMFVAISSGEFSQGTKSAAKNIEITAWVVGEDGSVIRNCIGRGIGKQSVLEDNYSTTVYYHVNNPVFNETFRIHLPAVPNILSCHLFMTVAHCSTVQTSGSGSFRMSMMGGTKEKKTRDVFAFGFMPFAEADNGGVIVGNGQHYMSCYDILPDMNLAGMDRNHGSGTVMNPGVPPVYLFDQGKLKIRNIKAGLTGSASQEYISMTTYVSSVRFTHVKCVHVIIHWAHTADSLLQESIRQCMSLPGISIAYCVRELITSSIGIMAAKDNLKEAAFDLFVHMLHLYESKVSNPVPTTATTGSVRAGPGSPRKKVSSVQLVGKAGMAPTRDVWSTCIEEAFRVSTGDRIHILMLQNLNTMLKGMAAPTGISRDRAVLHTNALKTIVVVLNLAVKKNQQGDDSQEMYAALCHEMGEVAKNLTAVVKSSHDGDVLRTLRGNFFDVFTVVEPFFEVEDMAEIGKQYLENLHRATENGGWVSARAVKKDKLMFMKSLVGSNVFAIASAREIVRDICLDILAVHLSDPNGSGEDRATSLVVLQTLLERTEIFDPEDCDELSRILSPLLDVTLKLLQGVQSRRGSLERADVEGRESVPSSRPNRRGSCVGNTAPMTTSNIMISLENAACCLGSLLQLLGQERVVDLIRNPSDKNTGRQLMLSLLVALTALTKRVIIPQPWLLLNMLFLNTVRETISWIADVLYEHRDDYLVDLSSRFVPRFTRMKNIELTVDPEDPGQSSAQKGTVIPVLAMYEPVNNLSIWAALFNLSLTVLLDPGLATESPDMNPAKQTYLSKNYKDFRLPVVEATSKVWDALTNPAHKLKFADHYTVPYLALACSLCPTLAAAGKKMVLDLLRCDFIIQKGFFSTAPHIYDSVSVSILGNNTISMESRYVAPYSTLVELMEGGLDNMFSTDEVLNCREAHNFASEMSTLLNLLRDLSRCPQTSEFEEERSYAYARLMEFFLSMSRIDAYTKFAHSLSKEMANMGHYPEAGNAILLHYNLLDWSNKQVDAVDVGDESGVLPVMKSWERKRDLGEQALSLLEEGKAFESCIKLLDELADLYKVVMPDYSKLAQILERQVGFYRRIATEDRFFPTMFRVGYYGQGFKNDAIRNKEFIYRGVPLESSIDFNARIKKKYPDMELIPAKVNPNPEEHFNSEKQLIQISKLSSANIREAAGGAAPDYSQLPPYIKAHLTNNLVNCFFYQRPYRKRAEKSANEFLDLWVEKKFLETAIVFPSHTRRAEVTKMSVVVLNPIEMAVQGLQERNADLAEKNGQMAALNDGEAGQSFTMSLRYESVLICLFNNAMS
jgi:hypothetical protein